VIIVVVLIVKLRVIVCIQPLAFKLVCVYIPDAVYVTPYHVYESQAMTFTVELMTVFMVR
jgi:hypothetical protein